MKSILFLRRVLLASSLTAPLLLLGCGGSSGGGNSAETAAPVGITVGSSKNLSEPYWSTDPAEYVRYQNELAEEKIIKDKATNAMIAEAGGWEFWDQLVAANDRVKIKVLMSKHGFEYSEVDPSVEASSLREAEAAKQLGKLDAAEPEAVPSALPNAASIGDCVKTFAPELRGVTYPLGSHTVAIDAFGRPGKATWVGSPATPISAGVRTGCQQTVASWGLPGDEGGHLIPNALGGFGGGRT